ncbi:SAF domain-containing protein [Gryllotalpicola ginsengisoli]|uniref:SAF domain-containing protein n=1 Tax=Gryllotalpicola ginsengisoli TaxID=444608 RepID=UPI00048993BC|nr:SAF domain-containing protein [Gryllotalpicola ginsengisoli]
MTQPVAVPPRPRPVWLEPRFVVGVLLVVASIAGVSTLLALADRTEVVYAARHALAAGDRIDADDIVAVRVRLGSAQASYLAAPPKPGAVVTRTVEKGELVPRGALGTAAGQNTTSVVVEVDGQLPESVDTGRAVDVWAAAAPATGGTSSPPQVLVSGATVVRLVSDDGLGSSSGVSVEVRIPKESAPSLLEAIANGDVVSVLPAGD